MAYTVTPLAGIDFYDTSLPTIPKFAPGTRIVGTDNVQAVYDPAAETITAGDLVVLKAAGCEKVTTANTGAGGANARFTLAIALVDMTAGTHGWFLQKGAATINCAASATAGDPLYTTSTPGRVSTTAAGSNLLLGINLRDSTSGSPAVTACSISSIVLARGTMGA